MTMLSICNYSDVFWPLKWVWDAKFHKGSVIKLLYKVFNPWLHFSVLTFSPILKVGDNSPVLNNHCCGGNSQWLSQNVSLFEIQTIDNKLFHSTFPLWHKSLDISCSDLSSKRRAYANANVLFPFLASQDALEVIVWVSEWVSQSQSYWL